MSKEHYCIGTWNVRSMNQGKLYVVTQEMARVNINILGISELKWMGMGDFNLDDHYFYYCGQESLRRNGVVLTVKKKSKKYSVYYVLSHFSHVQHFVTLWTIACQALLSMGFSRQEFWYWLSFPPPGKLPDQGSEPVSLMCPALANGFFTATATWEAQEMQYLGALSKNDRMISVLFQGKPFNITSSPTLYSKHLC